MTYRHYNFRGTWELKDSGVIESGVVPLRELFLVLPDDLIEFKLRDPDCNAVVEVENIGYIKKGSLCELQQWLAYKVYLEGPQSANLAWSQANGPRTNAVACPDPFERLTGGILCGVLSVGRSLGLPFCQ